MPGLAGELLQALAEALTEAGRQWLSGPSRSQPPMTPRLGVADLLIPDPLPPEKAAPGWSESAPAPPAEPQALGREEERPETTLLSALFAAGAIWGARPRRQPSEEEE
jgi:hypothetical protein